MGITIKHKCKRQSVAVGTGGGDFGLSGILDAARRSCGAASTVCRLPVAIGWSFVVRNERRPETKEEGRAGAKGRRTELDAFGCVRCVVKSMIASTAEDPTV